MSKMKKIQAKLDLTIKKCVTLKDSGSTIPDDYKIFNLKGFNMKISTFTIPIARLDKKSTKDFFLSFWMKWCSYAPKPAHRSIFHRILNYRAIRNKRGKKKTSFQTSIFLGYDNFVWKTKKKFQNIPHKNIYENEWVYFFVGYDYQDKEYRLLIQQPNIDPIYLNYKKNHKINSNKFLKIKFGNF